MGALPDAEIDLAAAALQLARIDAHDADWLAVERHLSEIARYSAAVNVAADDLANQGEALRALLARQLGYAGDEMTYEDLANANLIRVVQRRRGLPVALGIIWMHAAHAAGWDAVGLNAPGHFLLALRAGRHRLLVLDPYRGGEAVDSSNLSERVLAPMRRREVLLRLQNNIRLRRARLGDAEGASACAETMLLVAPDAVALWLETATLYAERGDIEKALLAFARVTALAPDSDWARQAREASERLRARLH